MTAKQKRPVCRFVLLRLFLRSLFVESEIKAVMDKAQGEEAFTQLEPLASAFGISKAYVRTDPQELITRIRAAARSTRDGCGWVIALITAIAAVVSAATALMVALR